MIEITLPSDWVWTKLGEITEVIRGASPRPKGDPKYFGGNIPWIMISDISKERGKYISKTKDTVTEEGARKSRYLNAGTLILSNSGTVCVLKILAVNGCIHDGFVAFPNISNKIIQVLYLYYYFEYIRPQVIQENKQGVTQINLNTSIVKDLLIPLPPLPEQRRIVARIEELFSRLDAGIVALQRAKIQLRRYRQAVLKAAVEGKLTEEWRKAHPEVEPAAEFLKRILSFKQRKLGKKFRESSELDTVGLPILPESWLWVRLDSLGSLKGGITKDAKRNVNNGRKVPYLRVANVQRGYLDLNKMKEIEASEEIISDLRLELGDILFNEGGDRDKLGRGWILQEELPECIHQNHVFRARLYSTEVSNKFVSWFGNTYGQRYFLKEGKQTTNLASVNITKLSAFPVPLPPYEEQTVIIEEIEKHLYLADESERYIALSLKRAESLRQSILKRAFEGKLVPQDPGDEPASVLLERIEAERAKAAPKSGRKKNSSNNINIRANQMRPIQ
jgi:type I restriction enzyme S subunit